MKHQWCLLGACGSRWCYSGALHHHQTNRYHGFVELWSFPTHHPCDYPHPQHWLVWARCLSKAMKERAWLNKPPPGSSDHVRHFCIFAPQTAKICVILCLLLTKSLQISASSLRRPAGRIIINKPEEAGQRFSCKNIFNIDCQWMTLT